MRTRKKAAEDTSQIQAELVEVTPALAAEWLERNVDNRKISAQVVTHYANAMRRGEWNVGTDGIGFDQNGDLIQGQHRLNSVILSGVTVTMLVVRGLPRSSQDTMDSGRRRTLQQQLARYGYKDSAAIASTLNFVYRLVNGYDVRHNNYNITTPQALQILEAHPDFVDSVGYGQRIRHKMLGYSSTAVSGLHFLWSQYNREDTTAFFDAVVNGANLSETDIRYILKHALDKDVAGNRARRQAVDARRHSALIIKAFNAWREDRLLTRLLWKTTGKMAEEFPQWDATFATKLDFPAFAVAETTSV